jgi:pyridoxine 5-phosphate synthase
MPNVQKAAIDCQNFGAEGITVHPRPDERHIRHQDVRDIKSVIKTEYNIEGYPSRSFMSLVSEIKPDQVTLVPDPPDAITSSEGWNTIKCKSFLVDVIAELKEKGIRSSIFIDTNLKYIENALLTGTDRIELYTEPYARNFPTDPDHAIAGFKEAAEMAHKLGLGINAGHDLSLENLKYFNDNIPGLLEVSIGHALISDALYFGLENTIQQYLRQLS